MPKTKPQRLIPDPVVARDYVGRSLKTLSRWDEHHELGFPKPIVINRRKYRDEDALTAWLRARVAPA
jgi:hypothetical protein